MTKNSVIVTNDDGSLTEESYLLLNASVGHVSATKHLNQSGQRKYKQMCAQTHMNIFCASYPLQPCNQSWLVLYPANLGNPKHHQSMGAMMIAVVVKTLKCR